MWVFTAVCTVQVAAVFVTSFMLCAPSFLEDMEHLRNTDALFIMGEGLTSSAGCDVCLGWSV